VASRYTCFLAVENLPRYERITTTRNPSSTTAAAAAAPTFAYFTGFAREFEIPLLSDERDLASRGATYVGPPLTFSDQVCCALPKANSAAFSPRCFSSNARNALWLRQRVCQNNLIVAK